MFTYFIGIDQTGASRPDGRPKPLPCALVINKTGHEKVISINLFLDSLNPSALSSAFPNIDLRAALILVDAVLGIPSSGTTKAALRDLFKKAHHYSHSGKPLGAKVAHRFFLENVLNTQHEEFPQREVEKIANANSIFRLTPFQRNIGCGTFRIWKELGCDTKWYSLWPYESKLSTTPLIAEGYPSYIWREWLGAKRGDATALCERIAHVGYKLVFESGDNRDNKRVNKFLSVDQMDACLLSLYASETYKKNLRMQLPHDVRTKEGWIFGVRG